MQPAALALHAGLSLALLPGAVLAVRPLRGGVPAHDVHSPEQLGQASQSPVAFSTRTVLATKNASTTKNVSCGPLATYPNSRPKNYADARATRYDVEAKETVEVTFSAGDTVEFECVPGYTTDGAKEGNKTFNVLCSEHGYYKPLGVCLKASKCGAVPTIPHAIPTGETTGDKVQFACASGYSLDGNQVVAGGMGRNQLFELECIAFSGEYEQFKGECKPYAFMPATETVRIYNQVFEALFIGSCKTTLWKAFGANGQPPAGLDAACDRIQDADLQTQCQGLVSQIKSDFETQKAAREAHDEAAKKDWYEAKDPERPGISDQAHTFCENLWKLLELQS